MSFKDSVTDVLANIATTLIKKNESYGNSAFEPVRIFSKADELEGLRVRIDDKLSRIAKGNDSYNEDTITDLIGYLILLKIKESEK